MSTADHGLAAASASSWSSARSAASRSPKDSPSARLRRHGVPSLGPESARLDQSAAGLPPVTLDSCFVGRGPELAALEPLVIQQVGASAQSAAFVIGLAGSGKTRLLAEVLGRSRVHALRVTGYEPEQAVPMMAARDVLRSLGRARGEAGTRLEALAFGKLPGGGTASPLRLFEAAYRAVAETAPVVVAVDDLQWVDEVTAALLTYLARAARADDLSLSIVAAGRPSARTGSIRDAVAAILPAGAVLDLNLGPLPVDEGIALVQAIAPGNDAAGARRVWERAGGSPFWIQALAMDADLLDASLSRRFSQLSEDGATALSAIAVVGRPAQYSELAAALDWPVDRTRRAIAELVARGLAIERSGAVEAMHDLVREAAARQLSAVSARTLHARLAGYLEASAADDVQQLREALDHTVAAGRPAIPLAQRVARAPQRRLIGSDGVRQLAALAEAADRADETRSEFELTLAQLSTELGDRVLELERWMAVAEQRHGLVRVDALLAAAKAAYRLGMREVAAGLIERARAMDAADLAAEIALDAQESAILRWLAHRLPEARALTTRAVSTAEAAIAERHSQPAPLAPRLRSAAIEAFQAAYDLALQDGDEPGQVALAERLRDLARSELEDIEARLLVASGYRRIGRMHEAEQLAREARDLAERRLYPAAMVSAAQHHARALYALGRLEEAERAAADAARLTARIGETGRFISEIRNLRPAIAVGRGDWRHGIEELRSDIEREPDPHYRLGAHQEIATWLARLGGPSAAQEVVARIDASEACLAEVGCPRCGRELALRSAEALARIGEIQRARTAMARAGVSRARHSREGRLFLHQAIAAVLRATASPTRAARSLARLSRRLTEAGHHREALWADLDRGAALATFDRPAAVATYRSVAERAVRGGVLTDAQLAQRRLRELGARIAPPRPRPGPLGLSRRELEIARMAAAGASNPEIAATLFLSRKTVERHVSAALAKVGARNRTELASRLTTLAGTGGGIEMGEAPDTRR